MSRAPFFKGEKKRKTTMQEKKCESCIYFLDSGTPHGNCLRFARFVDHAINETSRDCSYWETNSRD